MTATAVAPIARHPLLRRVRAELERLYGARLRQVLLYGSRARGEAHPDSDWDIAVILEGYDGGRAEREQLADLAFDLLEETGEFLSLKAFSPEDLERQTLFMENLHEDAVSL